MRRNKSKQQSICKQFVYYFVLYVMCVVCNRSLYILRFQMRKFGLYFWSQLPRRSRFEWKHLKSKTFIGSAGDDLWLMYPIWYSSVPSTLDTGVKMSPPVHSPEKRDSKIRWIITYLAVDCRVSDIVMISHTSGASWARWSSEVVQIHFWSNPRWRLAPNVNQNWILGAIWANRQARTAGHCQKYITSLE